MHQFDALVAIPPMLWRFVALARHRLLMLDYDGTLAPFRMKRDEALPSPLALRALERLVREPHTTVAIVSGRPLHELEMLVGELEIPLVGEHGWEEKFPMEKIRRHPFGGEARAWIDAAAVAPTLAPWRSRLERKRTAVVLHTRGLPAEEESAAIAAARATWAPPEHLPLTLYATHGGLELRATGHDKGTAAQALLARMSAETLAVFLGDDDTDEDAFDAVSERGFGVRVGHAENGSRALAFLPGTDAVAPFLDEWARLAGATR